MSEWIQSLPVELQKQVNSLIADNPSNLNILNNLFNYLTNYEEQNKKRKIEQPSQIKTESNVNLKNQIKPEEVIFEIPQVSFQSPLRKKLNLVFHLIEQDHQPVPVLSIVNPANYVPEISLINLKESVKLCMIIPILGNSTNPQKKGIVSLCFWINEEFASDSNKNDPIICQINLDLIKKQMIKSEKLPSDIENQFNLSNESDNLNMNPIQERIIDYFQRQFKLCGINLINYLPCSSMFNNRYTLNTDNGLALSTKTSDGNEIIIIDAHKGSKEGALLFLSSNEVNPSYLIYGFKKPVLLFDVSKIKNTSYSDITRNTFNLSANIVNDKNEEKLIEFSMIDQQYFQVIDDFIKRQHINDDSFNDQLREKNGNQQSQEQQQLQLNDTKAESDDEDEDANYQGGVEEESEVDEEYDSNAGGDSDNEDANDEEDEEDGVFNRNKEVEEED